VRFAIASAAEPWAVVMSHASPCPKSPAGLFLSHRHRRKEGRMRTRLLAMVWAGGLLAIGSAASGGATAPGAMVPYTAHGALTAQVQQRGGERALQGGGSSVRSFGGAGSPGFSSSGRGSGGSAARLRGFQLQTGPRPSLRPGTVEALKGVQRPPPSFSYGERTHPPTGRRSQALRGGRFGQPGQGLAPRVFVPRRPAYGYGAGCEWLRRQALATGSAYWWQRYRGCVL
jgi:hypothetical protein